MVVVIGTLLAAFGSDLAIGLGFVVSVELA